MTTTKTTIYLDAEDYRRLKALAARDGRTAADLVREAVAEYAARRAPRKLPRSLAMGNSGRGDISSRDEDYLKGMGEQR